MRDVLAESWVAGNYIIEEDGKVFSLRTGRYLSGGIGSNGRPFVVLWDGKRGHLKYRHILVAATYLGPKPPGTVVSHRDDNPLNNHKSNLVYETQKENLARRKFRDDGFHNSRAVLSPGDPETIREMRAAGMTHKEIAKTYGVSRTTISRVLNNLRYGDE